MTLVQRLLFGAVIGGLLCAVAGFPLRHDGCLFGAVIVMGMGLGAGLALYFELGRPLRPEEVAALKDSLQIDALEPLHLRIYPEGLRKQHGSATPSG